LLARRDAIVMSPPPHVKAFLIFRHIERCGKPVRLRLDGPFTRVYGRRFPLLLDPSFLFIRLAGGHGVYQASVRLVHVRSQKLLAYCTKTPFLVHSRLESKDFIMETPALILPWAGRYDLELFLDDRYCETATFDAMESPRRRRTGVPN
jgi:hypothetical protein